MTANADDYNSRPEFYNGYDVPDRSPRGGLTVGLVGSAGEPFDPTPSASLPSTQTTSVNLPNEPTAQKVTFNDPSGNVTVAPDADTGTSPVFVDFSGADATVNSFRIDPGGTFTYEGEPIESVSVIGPASGNAGTFSVFAQ